MAYLVGMPRAAWRRQPSQATSFIDDKLFGAFTPWGVAYPDGNIFSLLKFNGSIKIDSDGIYIPSRSTSLYSLNIYDFISQYTKYNFTFVGVIKPLVVSTTKSQFFSVCRLNNNAQHSLSLVSGNNTSSAIYVDNAGSEVAGYVYTENELINIVISNINGVAVCFVNGALIHRSGVSYRPFTGTASISLASNNSASISVYLAAIYNKVINENEARELSINPWQLFKPRIARFISIQSTVTFKPYWARSRSSILGSGV